MLWLPANLNLCTAVFTTWSVSTIGNGCRSFKICGYVSGQDMVDFHSDRSFMGQLHSSWYRGPEGIDHKESNEKVFTTKCLRKQMQDRFFATRELKLINCIFKFNVFDLSGIFGRISENCYYRCWYYTRHF